MRILPVNKIKLIVTKVLRWENCKNKSLSVVFCDNKLIKKLNKKYRNVDEPTDVLSFPFNENNFLGEIIISLEMLKSQAKFYNTSLKEEFFLVLVHGILHLLGYKHKRKNDVLRLKEKKYCENIKKEIL